MIQGILAIAAAYVCMKYRSQIVEMTGKYVWAEKYLGRGGSYTVWIVIGAFLFFWGIGNLTGTSAIFMGPFRALFMVEG